MEERKFIDQGSHHENNILDPTILGLVHPKIRLLDFLGERGTVSFPNLTTTKYFN